MLSALYRAHEDNNMCWLSHLSWTLAEIKDTEDWTSWNCNRQRTKSDQVATVKVKFILVRIQGA